MSDRQREPEQALPPDFLMTPPEVAKRLRVSVGWVRDHCSRLHPRLPVTPVGDLLRFRARDIEKWLDDQARLRQAIR